MSAFAILSLVLAREATLRMSPSWRSNIASGANWCASAKRSTSAELRRRLRTAGPQLDIAVLARKVEDLEAALAEKNADWISAATMFFS